MTTLKHLFNKNHWLFALIGVLILQSCETDETSMPGVPGEPEEIEVTHTIAQLKDLYDGSEIYTIEEDATIKGVVNSSDEEGNNFKNIYIQDETGGLYVGINKGDLYQDYAIGQTIYIKCQNLQLGNYGGLIQLGQEYNGSIGKIEEDQIGDFIFPGDAGDAPSPTILDLNDLPEDLDPIYSTWVTITGVQFNDEDAGKAYGVVEGQDFSAVNRTLTDPKANALVVRTSKYANFAEDLTPTLSGSVSGILTVFNGTLQLVLNTDADVAFEADRFEVSIGSGSGTLTDAYDVPKAKSKQGEDDKWVKGYIVGYLNNNELFTSADNALPSNMAIALDPNETDIANILSVQLSSSYGFVRSSLNLLDNPDNLGMEVWLNGNLEAYFGIPGIKSVYQFSLDGENIEEEPLSGIIGQGDDILGSSLTDTSIDFKTYNVIQSDEIWTASSGSAEINGYNNGANESWMISSTSIDFTGYTNPQLALTENISYGKGLEFVQVLISSDYSSGDPSAATWTDATVDGTRASGGATTTLFNVTGNVYIAFKYTNSDNTDASAWSISTVKAQEADNGGGTDPGTGEGTLANPYDIATAQANQDNGNDVWVTGFIIGYMENGALVNSADGASSSNMVIGSTAGDTDLSNALTVQLPSGFVRESLNLADNPGNLGIQVWLKGDLTAYFGYPGIKAVDQFSTDGENIATEGGSDPVGVANGDFEGTWSSDTQPDGWTKAENVTKETSIIHGGATSAKHTGDGTKDLSQYIEAEQGATYKISFWYYVETGDGSDARLWSFFKDASNANTGDIKGNDGDYLSNPNGNGAWNHYEADYTAPAGTTQIYLEFRTYTGAVVYYDDITVVKQ